MGFSKHINDYWMQTKTALGLGKFYRYDSNDTFILVIFTMVLITEREYGIRSARLVMDWFDIASTTSIKGYARVVKSDKFLVLGDREVILTQILKQKLTEVDIENFQTYMSTPQWLGAMIFVSKKYVTRDLGDIDDSALFPTNVTRERVASYLENPTKLPIFQQSMKFVNSIPLLGSRAMILHLVSITTSLVWYSNNASWNKEHDDMWVRGNKSNLWLERKARLTLEKNTSFNKGGIW